MQCVSVGINTPEFLIQLIDALTTGFRQPGYTQFLRKLKSYPEVWKGLKSNLDPVIVQDYSNANATGAKRN